ncbi:MAG: hypothetical protein KC731_12235 [Myxococcales bacterium]|nr:hypothetical protein [Myxococcales bacterium]
MMEKLHEESREQPEGSLEDALKELERAGLSRRAIAAAVDRAKLETSRRRSPGKRPPPRPRLDTDPDVDAWFD